MKPINEYTLQECLEGLRHETSGDVWNMGMREIIALTDRIHELTRWIPVEESLPDNGDTVLCRRVESGMFGSKEIKPQVGTFRNGSFDCVFDWTRVTHWRRIDTPEET